MIDFLKKFGNNFAPDNFSYDKSASGENMIYDLIYSYKILLIILPSRHRKYWTKYFRNENDIDMLMFITYVYHYV